MYWVQYEHTRIGRQTARFEDAKGAFDFYAWTAGSAQIRAAVVLAPDGVVVSQRGAIAPWEIRS